MCCARVPQHHITLIPGRAKFQAKARSWCRILGVAQGLEADTPLPPFSSSFKFNYKKRDAMVNIDTADQDLTGPLPTPPHDHHGDGSLSS
eukprot:CAMPEP_0185782804 /NCGR_PEP_ID=MMETSP1174-20130828/111897_1 /TAXON_ID=35687 /ORGANISM="Dictyocha speculum, Strain CCMP1381" /LENGTH=89 /DNA_ID=CAMNT_0028473491 /DNA_START=16 /DNA_END=282 /DNA_ORIENTATION=+